MKDTTAKLERREDEHCRQIDTLTKDNTVLRALVKATMESWENYSKALKAAEAAMEVK